MECAIYDMPAVSFQGQTKVVDGHTWGKYSPFLADEIGKVAGSSKIAGHSRVSITERYVHPGEDTIPRAFDRMAGSLKLVTDGGHR